MRAACFTSGELLIRILEVEHAPIMIGSSMRNKRHSMDVVDVVVVRVCIQSYRKAPLTAIIDCEKGLNVVIENELSSS